MSLKLLPYYHTGDLVNNGVFNTNNPSGGGGNGSTYTPPDIFGQGLPTQTNDTTNSNSNTGGPNSDNSLLLIGSLILIYFIFT